MRLSAALLSAAASIALSLAASPDARAGGPETLAVFGLTDDQRLIRFASDAPGSAADAGTIGGLVTDAALVGIDFRPATGDLYGLGDAGGVYVIDTATAAATLRSRLDVALSGARFGIDFNPTVDRLRVVSDAGQNLRVNVDTGMTTVDLPLAYTAPATDVTAVAYTNNDADPNTATTLLALDTNLDQVAVLSPPNDGKLAATGKLGGNAAADAGFDIYSFVTGGTTTSVAAFASLTAGGRSRFASIQVATGRAVSLGRFRAGDVVIDVALPPNQAAAE